MSTLETIDRQPFEDILGMSSGFVLDFTNATFRLFISETSGKDIYSDRYSKYGDSKAKRLRAFWEIESDLVVAKTLSKLIELWQYKNPEPDAKQRAIADRCIEVAMRLGGKSNVAEQTEEQFLAQDFTHTSIKNLPIESTLVPILEARFQEAIRCCGQSDAPLASIFMCGSILEGLLLGIALANPRKFNQASSSPIDHRTGKVKQFQHWKLAELIEVACELAYLGLDVKKFSHVLREFRNFIHPYQQMSQKFSPDMHTALICLQVLRAAIASLSNVRR